LTDARINIIAERDSIARRNEPRAAAARYDRRLGRVIVELTNGCSFTFPPRLAQGLETATAEQLAAVEVLGAGYGLHWEALDADLSIPGLLAPACSVPRPAWPGTRARRRRQPRPRRHRRTV